MLILSGAAAVTALWVLGKGPCFELAAQPPQGGSSERARYPQMRWCTTTSPLLLAAWLPTSVLIGSVNRIPGASVSMGARTIVLRMSFAAASGMVVAASIMLLGWSARSSYGAGTCAVHVYNITPEYDPPRNPRPSIWVRDLEKLG